MKLNFALWANVDKPPKRLGPVDKCHGARCGQGVGPRHARHARPEAGPARGCAWLRVAPVPAPSGAALALRCAPRRPGRVGTRGVPTINPWPPARVEQGAAQGSKQAREEGSSIRGRRLRVGALRDVACRNPEQVLPTRLDDGPGMACHGLPGTGVLPKRNGGKAQAGGDDRQDQATDGPASDAELPSPGQHPPLQLVQAPAHPGSPVSLTVRVGRGFDHGKSGIVRCRRARTWPANALGAPYSGFGALSASRLPAKGQTALSGA